MNTLEAQFIKYQIYKRLTVFNDIEKKFEIKEILLPTEKAICELEAEIGTLPDDYKYYLKNFNHIEEKQNLKINCSRKLPESNGQGYFLFPSFRGVLPEYPTYDLMTYARNQYKRKFLPRNLLPIADVYVRDDICLNLNPGPYYGKVYYWPLEKMWEYAGAGVGSDIDPKMKGVFGEATYPYIIFDSFTEMVSNIDINN